MGRHSEFGSKWYLVKGRYSGGVTALPIASGGILASEGFMQAAEQKFRIGDQVRFINKPGNWHLSGVWKVTALEVIGPHDAAWARLVYLINSTGDTTVVIASQIEHDDGNSQEIDSDQPNLYQQMVVWHDKLVAVHAEMLKYSEKKSLPVIVVAELDVQKRLIWVMIKNIDTRISALDTMPDPTPITKPTTYTGLNYYNLPDWQRRVVDEKQQLDERIKNLSAFTREINCTALPVADQILLNTQLSIMIQLTAILAERINRFGSQA